MINLEIKTSLSPEDEKKFLDVLLESITQVERNISLYVDIQPSEHRFIRSIGTGVK